MGPNVAAGVGSGVVVHAEYALERPTTGLLLRRGLVLHCPQCGSGHLFRWWLFMKDDCPQCDLHFERVEGHWIGAIAMNTILTLLLMLGVLVGGFAATYPDSPNGALLWVLLAIGGLGPLVFHPFSRTLWSAIDLAMRPIAADEIS
jgi:uncharacterized protein (DUF983 family)